jgi:hypothetical protein
MCGIYLMHSSPESRIFPVLKAAIPVLKVPVLKWPPSFVDYCPMDPRGLHNFGWRTRRYKTTAEQGNSLECMCLPESRFKYQEYRVRARQPNEHHNPLPGYPYPFTNVSRVHNLFTEHRDCSRLLAAPKYLTLGWKHLSYQHYQHSHGFLN